MYLIRMALRSLGAMLLAFVLVTNFVPSAVADLEVGSDSTLYHSPTDRFGFGFVSGIGGAIDDYDVHLLGAGWYVNWGSPSANPYVHGLEFVPIIRLCDQEWRDQNPEVYDNTTPSTRRNCGPPYTPSGSALDKLVQQHPGLIWLIGNEPDAPLQDAIRPAVYIELYHELYHRIKSIDPTARIAIGGIVQATPLRMQWINKVWDGYQERYGVAMPVDVWNIHNFVLREVRKGKGLQCRPPGASDSGDWGAHIPPGIDADCGLWVGVNELDRMDLFVEQIVRFRTWMRDKGQRDKELIVTEYGILFNEELGYSYPRVRDYMIATFDYFMTAKDPDLGLPADGNRLVQRWAWYSLNDTSFVWGTTRSALFDNETNDILPLGIDFANYVTPLFVPFYNLEVASMGISSIEPIVYGVPAQIDLRVTARNWGNAPTSATTARWWRVLPGSGTSLLGDSVLGPVPVRRTGTTDSTLTWSTTIAGPERIRVRLNATETLPEVDFENNWGEFLIDVNLRAKEVTSLPAIPKALLGGTTSVKLRARVENKGHVTIPTQQVGFWKGHPNTGQFLQSVTVTNLAAGQSKVVEITTPLGVGHHEIHAYVDFDDSIHESNIDDNIVKGDVSVVASCYDFDGSGEVTILDVQAVANRWRMQPGQPGWPQDSIYDLDGDRRITVRDVMLAGTQLGQSCP